MGLDDIFRDANERIASGRVSAAYHPYKDLKHTWRLSHGALNFRVSDYLKGAPPEVTDATAWYLLCRARRDQCPVGKVDTYMTYIRSKEMWAPKREVFISRAKGISFRPKGTSRDLDSAFDYVNSMYFSDALERPELAWARESPSRRIGFYHPPLNILAVNRALDSERVPRFVLEFVVYHELLHGVLEPVGGPDRRVHHTAEFRRRERAFSRYEEAETWITRISRRAKEKKTGSIVPQV
ncbi:MAG: hypothetical protein MUO94_00150 [Thermoplasmata archaeon]|nr:hypothetical protein [Thermoplasmata archaeon]